MESFIDYLISEAVKLTPNELKKPNSKTGEPRIDILKREIQKGSPLELEKGGTFLAIPNELNFAAIDQFKKDGKAFLLVDKNGKSIKVSDLKKGAVFGGGGSGAGGGTAQTAIAESAQCVWLQAMLDHGYQHDVSYFTDDILKAAFKKVDVGNTSLDKILNISEDWIKSSYLSGQYIIKNGYVKKGMKFHRDSAVMKGIYKIKNAAFKNNGYPKFTDDKWNPGDIWATAPDFKLKELPDDSIRSLNRKILDLFVSRRLVGISLKKIVKAAKHKDLNVKLPPDTDDYKVKQLLLQGAKRGTFWSSKGGTIIYDDGKLLIKDNSYLGINKVEIVGKTARGGGAGWGYIMHASQAALKKSLPPHAKIKQTAIAIAKGDKRSTKLFWDMTRTMYPNMSEEEFQTELATKDAGWISAKLGALYIITSIHNNMGPKANRFITKLINYAGSKTEDSSAYVKIYE